MRRGAPSPTATVPRVHRVEGGITKAGELRATVTFLVPKEHAEGFLDALAAWLDAHYDADIQHPR